MKLTIVLFMLDDISVGVGETSQMFEICVQSFHLYGHYHGVVSCYSWYLTCTWFICMVKELVMILYYILQDISMDFKELVSMWQRKDEITVCDGERRWSLEIRKGKGNCRTTIHDEWLEFNDDIQLKCGDVCRFTSIRRCFRKFTVSVIRNS